MCLTGRSVDRMCSRAEWSTRYSRRLPSGRISSKPSDCVSGLGCAHCRVVLPYRWLSIDHLRTRSHWAAWLPVGQTRTNTPTLSAAWMLTDGGAGSRPAIKCLLRTRSYKSPLPFPPQSVRIPQPWRCCCICSWQKLSPPKQLVEEIFCRHLRGCATYRQLLGIDQISERIKTCVITRFCTVKSR
jgi:hypothetical protein